VFYDEENSGPDSKPFNEKAIQLTPEVKMSKEQK